MMWLEARTESQRRWITGVLGIILFVFLLGYCGLFGVFLITCCLSLAMANEFGLMAFKQKDCHIKRHALMLVSLITVVFSALLSGVEGDWIALVFLGCFTFFLYLVRFTEPSQFLAHIHDLGLFVMGVLYVGVIPSYLVKIQQVQNGSLWNLFFFFMIWGTDTGAYFAGRTFGGPKLFEKVSPKKTRSGAMGGLIVAYLVAVLFKIFILKEITWVFLFLAPALVSILAQVGDFSESLIKRAFEVKDSGSLLPGHGGFLDRFDGVVFGLPIMYACMKILNSL